MRVSCILIYCILYGLNFIRRVLDAFLLNTELSSPLGFFLLADATYDMPWPW
jgi:hypothetical protein